MMDLWTELQRVRKQFVELKEQTVHDLENQRNEFIKVVRSVGGFTRQLNLTGVEVRVSTMMHFWLLKTCINNSAQMAFLAVIFFP